VALEPGDRVTHDYYPHQIFTVVSVTDRLCVGWDDRYDVMCEGVDYKTGGKVTHRFHDIFLKKVAK
jgi:hypothetical protein